MRDHYKAHRRKADLTVKDENGNIIRQGDGKPWVKASEFEMHRMGILQFESDEDRTAFSIAT